MKQYTIGQLQDLHDYLMYSVKEGYMEAETAEAIENAQDWKTVEYMMAKGDAIANENQDN